MKENNIINNLLLVDKNKISNKIKDIINFIKKEIVRNHDLILQANQIDLDNNNGFKIDFDIINLIFENVENDNIWYGDVTKFECDQNKKIIYGKQIMDIGNVLVINEGNTYVLIEMILRNIKAGNSLIFTSYGYMYGTNNLIVDLVQSILEQLNISKYLVQLYVTEIYDNILNNYANLDLVIVIGDQLLHKLVLGKNKNKVIISGYDNYELYIDDLISVDLINKICNSGLNIQLYVKDGIDINYNNILIVNDIDEAIAKINYNGCGYGTGIFTNDIDNAEKFICNVKANMVTVNTSPSIERIIDINQENLIRKKTIIYPGTFKLTERIKEINLLEDNLNN